MELYCCFAAIDSQSCTFASKIWMLSMWPVYVPMDQSFGLYLSSQTKNSQCTHQTCIQSTYTSVVAY
ncbi:hypothetical protein SCA6_009340 [Theobroma cacao]